MSYRALNFLATLVTASWMYPGVTPNGKWMLSLKSPSSDYLTSSLIESMAKAATSITSHCVCIVATEA
eukprot:3228780-Prorocentrum_lima.AAC.1